MCSLPSGSSGTETVSSFPRTPSSATLPEKVTAAKFLTEIGAATLDQILTMFDMPTIGGEEGARRVQTLNMVNAKLADKYQTGGNTPPDDTTPPGEPTGGKEEG